MYLLQRFFVYLHVYVSVIFMGFHSFSLCIDCRCVWFAFVFTCCICFSVCALTPTRRAEPLFRGVDAALRLWFCMISNHVMIANRGENFHDASCFSQASLPDRLPYFLFRSTSTVRLPAQPLFLHFAVRGQKSPVLVVNSVRYASGSKHSSTHADMYACTHVSYI